MKRNSSSEANTSKGISRNTEPPSKKPSKTFRPTKANKVIVKNHSSESLESLKLVIGRRNRELKRVMRDEDELKSENKELVATNASLSAQLLERDRFIRECELEISNMRGQIEAVHDIDSVAKSSNSYLMEQLEWFQSENISLKGQLDAGQIIDGWNLPVAVTRIRMLDIKIKSLKCNAGVSKTTIAGLRQELDHKVCEIEQLQQKIGNSHGQSIDNGDLNSKLKRLQGEIGRLQKDNFELLGQRAEMQAKMMMLDGHLSCQAPAWNHQAQEVQAPRFLTPPVESMSHIDFPQFKIKEEEEPVSGPIYDDDPGAATRAVNSVIDGLILGSAFRATKPRISLIENVLVNEEQQGGIENMALETENDFDEGELILAGWNGNEPIYVEASSW